MRRQPAGQKERPLAFDNRRLRPHVAGKLPADQRIGGSFNASRSSSRPTCFARCAGSPPGRRNDRLHSTIVAFVHTWPASCRRTNASAALASQDVLLQDPLASLDAPAARRAEGTTACIRQSSPSSTRGRQVAGGPTHRRLSRRKTFFFKTHLL